MHRLLVIDDETQLRTALYEVLKRRGYDVVAVDSGKEGIERLKQNRFDAVITDVKMPGMGGLDVLRSVRCTNPHTPVLMMTAFGTIESAIEAMKEGARDYILKPFSPELIDSAIKKVLIHEDNHNGFEIITRSSKMQGILEIARSIAPSSVTVLITGESGTGKELLARYIHDKSSRKAMPFVAINCASIPDGLLESELFGHEKGSFTGAVAGRKGKFELANEGTILLDEIGEMGLNLQAKLLRVLQQKEIDKIGGSKPLQIDIRVIATTNRELKKEVDAKRFREDLFYRLNVFPIVIPPLRERMEDITILADYFLEKFCKKNGKDIEGISDDAMKYLKSYQWKGNVREFENVMERAVLMCRGCEIKAKDIACDNGYEKGGQGGISSEMQERHSNGTLRDMEKGLIFKALKDTEGNKTRAAKTLGISIRTLRNKLREYGMRKELPTKISHEF
ncbi:MAG: sigma-54-dependent Fis family transcriptional regulator [Deltaproteobacteria bacterium]|nr:sigma-54-dependent Fis family transcriptional regulator [Deltaproteobacteria bacterium]